MFDLPALLLGPATTAAAGAALMAAAAHDIAERRIPNRCVAIVGGAALLFLLAGQAPMGWPVGLALGWLLLALPLFAWGQLGGGDVKLMAVLLLWAGPLLLAPFLLLLAGATIATAAGLLMWRQAAGPLRSSPSLPFGLPLAVAGLPILLAQAGHWPDFHRPLA